MERRGKKVSKKERDWQRESRRGGDKDILSSIAISLYWIYDYFTAALASLFPYSFHIVIPVPPSFLFFSFLFFSFLFFSFLIFSFLFFSLLFAKVILTFLLHRCITSQFRFSRYISLSTITRSISVKVKNWVS